MECRSGKVEREREKGSRGESGGGRRRRRREESGIGGGRNEADRKREREGKEGKSYSHPLTLSPPTRPSLISTNSHLDLVQSLVSGPRSLQYLTLNYILYTIPLIHHTATLLTKDTLQHTIFIITLQSRENRVRSTLFPLCSHFPPQKLARIGKDGVTGAANRKTKAPYAGWSARV